MPASFLPEQFAAFGHNYKKHEQTPQWKKLHQKPDAKLDVALEQRRLRCERHFEEEWKDDGPEAIAREEVFLQDGRSTSAAMKNIMTFISIATASWA
jgi:hypothetical protein